MTICKNGEINNNQRGIINQEIEESFTLFFPKKLASGDGISWISKEQYLRNDITCKYHQCEKCKDNIKQQLASIQIQRQQQNQQDNINEDINSQSLKGNQLLLSPPQPTTTTKEKEIIVIPDINVILDYLEILELPDTTFRNIVVLETVYKYVQYNSGPKHFEKVKSFINLAERSSCYFSNELFIETYVDRNEEDSVLDHQNKVICKAVQWYSNHFNKDKYRVILLCSINNEDQQQQQQQEDESINSSSSLYKMAKNKLVDTMSLFEYLEFLNKSTTTTTTTTANNNNKELLELYDSITQLLHAKKQQQLENNNKTNNTLFTRYLNDDVLQTELKSGNILSGKIHYNSHNREEAFVKISSTSGIATNQTNSSFYGDKVMIIGKINQNRAIHGDKVGVALLPESEWLPYDSSIKLDYAEEEEEEQKDGDVNDNSGNNNSSNNNKLNNGTINGENNQLKIPTGKIVGIFQRNWRDYVGTVEKNTNSFTNFVLVVPFDWRIPVIRIPTKNSQQFIGKRLIVRIDNWDLNSNYPMGHYVSTIGESGSLETELQALMVEHDISLKPWPLSILKCLPESSESEPWQIPPEEFKYRRVLTNHHTMSIDPLGSKDIDDAISIGYPSDDIVEIGVHIADVSFFVKEGSALDIEARRRGTTIYLPDRRFDMLPAVLSEDICSLRGGFPRCAMSCIWQFKKGTCEILNTWFGRTIIHSSGELHYQLAQDIIDGKVVDGKDKDTDVTNGGKNAGYRNRVFNGLKISDIKKDLINLRTVFRQLKKNREDNGALDLESIEVRFQFNQDSPGKPEKIILKNDLEIHSLVAEYMILANSSVATKIHSAFPSSSLLRRHPKPNQINFESIKPLFNLCGFDLNTKTNKELAESLNEAKDDGDHFINQILKLKTVNIVSEAVYFSTGSINVNEYYHYGLALEKYTHFTSPIRRYSDIIVHRQLWNSLTQNGQSGNFNPYDNYSMTNLTDHLNIRHRASKTVQRDATELFQSLYFQLKPKENVEAIITDIRSNGIVVYVPEFGLRSRVFLVKDNEYLITPGTLFPESFGSITKIEFNDLNLKIHLSNHKDSIELSIFDHIKVNIHTEESNYHLPPIKLDLVQILEKQKKQINKNDKNKNKKSNSQQQKQQKQQQQQQQQDSSDIKSFKDKKSLIEEIKKTEKDLKKDQDILQDPNSKEYIQSNEINIFNLLQQFSNLNLIQENGSKINYNLGKKLNKTSTSTVTSISTSSTPTNTTNKKQQQQQQQQNDKNKQPQIKYPLKLWSMTDEEIKQYKKKSDKELRDSISNKYKSSNNTDENNLDDNDQNGMNPNLSVKDKYSYEINKAERDLRKANFQEMKSRHHGGRK